MTDRSKDRLRAALLAVLVVGGLGAAPLTTWWTSAGHNLFNTHSQPRETQLSTDNVDLLTLKWSLETAGNVTATPTVYQGAVYVPDMGGMLWSANLGSGHVRWSRSIASYTGIANDVSRTSPAIAGSAIILGNGWIRNA